jgi:hypothetical protein
VALGRVGRKSRLSKKAKRGFRGYPVATVAFYGPNADFASKVAIGIVKDEDGEPDMHRWHSTGRDVRVDPDIETALLELLQREGVKSVTLMDRIIGCPHEQGVDYEGDWCPECPYWHGRDRFTGEVVH